MAYHAAPPPGVHFDPRDIHDWEIAGAGQWFLGILDTATGIARFVPAFIQEAMQVLPGPDPSNAQPGQRFHISQAKPSVTARRLNAANADTPRQPWRSLPPDLRPGINWLDKADYLEWKREAYDTLDPQWRAFAIESKPALQDHGRVIDFLGLNSATCLGFSLAKTAAGVIYIDKSNSTNMGKAGTRPNPEGGTHMPMAWNQAFVAAFSSVTGIGVDHIDIKECAHGTHTDTYWPRVAEQV